MEMGVIIDRKICFNKNYFTPLWISDPRLLLQVAFAALSSCRHQNKELRGRDTIVGQRESFIGIHSEGGLGQSQSRQRPRSFRGESISHVLPGRCLFD